MEQPDQQFQFIIGNTLHYWTAMCCFRRRLQTGLHGSNTIRSLSGCTVWNISAESGELIGFRPPTLCLSHAQRVGVVRKISVVVETPEREVAMNRSRREVTLRFCC